MALGAQESPHQHPKGFRELAWPQEEGQHRARGQKEKLMSGARRMEALSQNPPQAWDSSAELGLQPQGATSSPFFPLILLVRAGAAGLKEREGLEWEVASRL